MDTLSLTPDSFEAALSRTIAVLRAGHPVVVPTETIYGLAALASSEDAVAQILAIKERGASHPLTLALGNVETLEEFIPDLVGLGQRLARRCLPGPLTLVLETPSDGALAQLPDAVRAVVVQDGFVGFRMSSHPFTQRLLQELGEPIVLTSVNRTGQPPAHDAATITATVGNAVSLAVCDEMQNAPPTNTPSTVVKVIGNRFDILREGNLSASTLARLTTTMVLFVCTGNTCRSPMAEAFCEALLAERLHCTPDELEERFHYVVLSAGVMAAPNHPASSHAQTVVAEMGEALSLAHHRSQQLTEQHVRFADVIFVLTRGHRDAILSQWPDADSRTLVLNPDGTDINDPFGGSLTDYRLCAAQIQAALYTRVREIV